MDKDLIIITEYYTYSKADPQFILLLEEEGLISTEWIDGKQYLYESEIQNIDKYARWYYDLSINIEGIDAIQRLLREMESMQHELKHLRKFVASHFDKNGD